MDRIHTRSIHRHQDGKTITGFISYQKSNRIYVYVDAKLSFRGIVRRAEQGGIEEEDMKLINRSARVLKPID